MENRLKNRALLNKERQFMYKQKGPEAEPLFKELFPFGGQLDSSNRWLKIKDNFVARDRREICELFF